MAFFNTQESLLLKAKTQLFTYILRKKDILWRTALFTFWTEKTDGLKEV